MQQLTTTGKLLIIALVLGLIYGGYKLLGGSNGLKELTQQENTTLDTKSPEPTAETASSEASSSSSSEATDVATDKAAFSYSPPPPVNGKLKGVVELGATGFNSFIVTMDKNKNWKLEKAEFGNSLVTENMATDEDIRAGLKQFIGKMLDFGVGGRDIHFVVSSGAMKADVTQKIIKNLKTLKYVVNTVTPEQEGKYGLKAALPADFQNKGFMADIGSGNTKLSWIEGATSKAVESYGAKYFQNNTADDVVFDDVKAKAKQIPSAKREVCFIIGGVPFELAKQVRNGKERFTVLNTPDQYKSENAKQKAGLNIYKALAESTGCNQFVFDWDANFTIGALLEMPY